METHQDIAIQADRLAALGNEARLGILKLLLSNFLGELSAGDIAKATAIPASTLSHHLDRLRREGLVESRKDKQWIWYRAGTDALTDLLNFLYHDCCGGCDIQISARNC